MKYPLPIIVVIVCFYLTTAAALDANFSRSDLLQRAVSFPEQPRDTVDLPRGQKTFGSGTPYNDLVETIVDTSYMEGETSGYDHFYPADPGETFPGDNRVSLIKCVSNLDLDSNYDSDQGDRIILGTYEREEPFFLAGSDGIDNEWCAILHLNYREGHIQLRGVAEDYSLIYATEEEGVATEGYYLFYVKGSEPDLIAFIFPCDDIETPIGGVVRATEFLCNSDGFLSLDNPNQFVFDQPDSRPSKIAGFLSQFGSASNEIVGGVTIGPSGEIFVAGSSGGNLDGADRADTELFVYALDPEGERLWVTEIGQRDGALFFDIISDESFVYAVGRTLGALDGFSNAGRWDAIIVKYDIADGRVVDTYQWGSSGIDGYGNVTLDDSGHLFVSGVGSPDGANHLIEKIEAETLDSVWRVTETPASNRVFVSEAWGGISYHPGNLPGDGHVAIAGWFMTTGGADAFVSVYNDLNEQTPIRSASTIIQSEGTQADWLLGNVIDEDGNIYLAGYTTGDLGAPHKGKGDAYVVKFPLDLSTRSFVQVGSEESDQFRRLVRRGDRLYAVGYTYGDIQQASYIGFNADRDLRSGDILIYEFDLDLNPLNARVFGSQGEERAFPALKDSVLTLAGTTDGSFQDNRFGAFDAFVMQFPLDNTAADEFEPSVVSGSLIDANSLLTQFPVESQGLYQLHRRIDLTVGTWVPVGNPFSAGIGELAVERVLPIGGRQIFYRLEEVE